ncbi:MAG: AMP-binding protein, partial [Caldimonas sp.]
MKPTIHFGAAVDDAEIFHRRVLRAAAALIAAGIGKGDVVALMLRNEPVLLELMLAARWIGARWCLVNWHFKAAEVRHILSDSEAKILIVHADLRGPVAVAVPLGVRVFVVEPQSHTRLAFDLPVASATKLDVAENWRIFRDEEQRPAPPEQAPGSAMVYTSGTTGMPKGIRREAATQQQLLLLAERSRIVLGMAPGMRGLVSAPMYHSAPATYAIQASLNDAHLWIEPKFEAERTLQLIERERISHLYLVPTMYVRLLRLDDTTRRRYDLGSVRFVVTTGSPCGPDLKRRMIEWWGPVFHEAYAASELGWISHIDSAESLQRPGSAGRAVPGVQLKVRSDDGKDDLPAGTVGLLFARDPAVPDFTYANNDGARRAMESDGLWTLGDMGYLDADGYLYVVDRKSDMVISGGVNIYPAEIEAVLMTMPGVADCAIFGIPDDEFGEALAAAVQRIDGGNVDEAALRLFLRERLADFKVPRVVVFHDRLPREETGKIFKRRLREPFWEH